MGPFLAKAALVRYFFSPFQELEPQKHRKWFLRNTEATGGAAPGYTDLRSVLISAGVINVGLSGGNLPAPPPVLICGPV